MDLPCGTQFLADLQSPGPNELKDQKLGRPYFGKYWDSPSLFAPAPPTREGWERRHELSTATPALIAELRKAGYEIASAEMLGHGMFHTVYVLKLKDNSELLVRISFNFRTDAGSRGWAESKMKRETAVLPLLHSNPFIPNVIHCSPSTENDVISPYMILQRLPGVSLGEEGYKSILSSIVGQEHFVRSLAEAFVQVFSVTLPEIGSVVGLTPDGQPVIGSLIDTGETDHIVAEGPVKTIEEYLDAMIVLANVRNMLESVNHKQNPTPDDPDLPSLMNRLRTLAVSLIPKDNTLARIALVRSDTNADNILIYDGVISGLIDWERSAALPAYLAARYSRFLRSDGIWDPRFESRDRKMNRYPEEWPTTEQEFENFREIFRNAVSKLSPEYSEALHKGGKLRQLFEWLEFASWSGQTTWDGCDRWERATRSALEQ
ncbi:hypothetical protein B0H17DRAFT_1032943 [Mycena rosella]|uniref:Aminoglycoside phosphotransferase domain-containing protein n=1 Tax=Mycena rosella TaxID=1033263 RepID=A0AAD7GXU5_MYCRO|nr:hypothetical protein B0H17DRAFT_1032943 [Mycena rosella]